MALIMRRTDDPLPRRLLPIYMNLENASLAHVANVSGASTTAYSSTQSETEGLETNITSLSSVALETDEGALDESDAQEVPQPQKRLPVLSNHLEVPKSYPQTVTGLDIGEMVSGTPNAKNVVETARENGIVQVSNSGEMRATSDDEISSAASTVLEERDVQSVKSGISARLSTGNMPSDAPLRVDVEEELFVSERGTHDGSSAPIEDTLIPTERHHEPQKMKSSSLPTGTLFEPPSGRKQRQAATLDSFNGGGGPEQGYQLAQKQGAGESLATNPRLSKRKGAKRLKAALSRFFRRISVLGRRASIRSTFKPKRKTLKRIVAISTVAGASVTLIVMASTGKSIGDITGVLLVILAVGAFTHATLQSEGEVEGSEHGNHMKSLAEQEDGAVDADSPSLHRRRGWLARREEHT
ncbi:hypothetical protein MMC13_003403 [Lambiella insularis]|nr:hypothetical protein [Lambiella insularis]